MQPVSFLFCRTTISSLTSDSGSTHGKSRHVIHEASVFLMYFKKAVMQLVLESPVWSGYWVPCGSNHDQDWLGLPRKPRKTGLDWYKPVTSQLARLFIGYRTGL